MICIAVRIRKSSMSHLGRNSESHLATTKRMNTLSIKDERADIEDSDVLSTKDLIFETES